jgi:hypothetical protein
MTASELFCSSALRHVVEEPVEVGAGVMRVSVQKSNQRERALPQHQFRMPARKVAKPEQAEEERPRRQQAVTERYLLQIDKQTKRSFRTPEDAQAMALEIKARFQFCRSRFMTAQVIRARCLANQDQPRQTANSDLFWHGYGHA